MKTLFKNSFIAIREHDDYFYAHDVRARGKLVAVLPYRQKDENTYQYGVHMEVCPAHGDTPSAYSITGGVGDKSPEETALKELWEEVGYRVTVESLIPLGEIYAAKNIDTRVYLYAVDVTGLTAVEPPTDGSRFEQIAYPEWLTYTEALAVTDALFLSMLLRLGERLKS